MGCVSSTATSDSAQPPRGGAGGGHRSDRLVPVNAQAVPTSRTSQQASEAPKKETFSSQSELEAQREEFWGSRVEGDSMVWVTLRSAAEACIANDLGLCEAILAASGILSPNGALNVCYDDRGHEYNVPLYCYSSSPDLIQPPKIPSGEPVLVEMSRTGPPGKPLKLKVKINPGDHLLVVNMFENDTVGMLKQGILEKAKEVAETGTKVPSCTVARQRMILMGKELKAEKQRLIDAKMDEDKVIQIFLKPEKKQ